MKNQRGFIEAVVIFFCFLGLVIGLAMVSYGIDKTSCTKKSELIGLEFNYGWWTGCMVKIDNKWQPFNEYNTVNIN